MERNRRQGRKRKEAKAEEGGEEEAVQEVVGGEDEEMVESPSRIDSSVERTGNLPRSLDSLQWSEKEVDNTTKNYKKIESAINHSDPEEGGVVAFRFAVPNTPHQYSLVRMMREGD